MDMHQVVGHADVLFAHPRLPAPRRGPRRARRAGGRRRSRAPAARRLGGARDAGHVHAAGPPGVLPRLPAHAADARPAPAPVRPGLRRLADHRPDDLRLRGRRQHHRRLSPRSATAPSASAASASSTSATPLGRVLPGFFAESVWSPALGVAARDSTANQVRVALDWLGGVAADERVLLFINVSATHPPHAHLSRRGDRGLPRLAGGGAGLRRFASCRRCSTRCAGAGGASACVLADHGEAHGEDGRRGHRIAHPTVTTVPYAHFLLVTCSLARRQLATTPIPATSTATRTRRRTARSTRRAARATCGPARTATACSATSTSPSAPSAARSATCSPTSPATPRPARAYVDALGREMGLVAEALGPMRFARLYLGGGHADVPRRTPSCAGSSAACAARSASTRPRPRAASSAAPRRSTRRRSPRCASSGFRRLSLGVQSFREEELRQVNRRFDPRLHRRGDPADRRAGFPHFNIDLIYGLPGQTLATWRDSLARAVDTPATSLFLYPLYVRPLTGLGVADVARPRPTTARDGGDVRPRPSTG